MTKKCKNPECSKEVLETQNYCSEECVRKHIEIKNKDKEREKPTSGFIHNTKEQLVELDEICYTFGFKHTDGIVSGSHNAQILSYLIMRQEEVYSTTVNKLTWICHMSARSLKENYLKGIEDFGLIETYTNSFGVLKWRWVGIKALRNNGNGN